MNEATIVSILIKFRSANVSIQIPIFLVTRVFKAKFVPSAKSII